MEKKINDLVLTHRVCSDSIDALGQQVSNMEATVVQSQAQCVNTLTDTRKAMEEMVRRVFGGRKTAEKEAFEKIIRTLNDKIRGLVAVQTLTSEQLQDVHSSVDVMKEKNREITRLIVEVHVDYNGQEFNLEQSTQAIHILWAHILHQNTMLVTTQEKLANSAEIVRLQISVEEFKNSHKQLVERVRRESNDQYFRLKALDEQVTRAAEKIQHLHGGNPLFQFQHGPLSNNNAHSSSSSPPATRALALSQEDGNIASSVPANPFQQLPWPSV